MNAALDLFREPKPTLYTCLFTVIGEPVPCGRPRSRIVRPRGREPFIQVYADPKSAAYEKLIGEVARTVRPNGWRSDWGRYRVTVRVYQSEQRGDWDNFGKAVGDGCQGVLWGNDRRARSGRVDILDEFDRPRLEVLAEMVGDLDLEQDRKARARLLASRRKESK